MKIFLLITGITALLVTGGCTMNQNNPPPQSTNSPYPLISSGSSESLTPITQGSNFKAIGTEPFWSMELSDTKATVTQPSEDGSTREESYDIQQIMNGSTITVKDMKGEFSAMLEKKPCQDSMSDTKYEYSVSVNYKEFALRGCAHKN